MSDDLIYRPFSKLVRIRILDRWFEVPENNILLRCFQYVAPSVPYGPFCWNGDCENDRIRCKEAGSAQVRPALACQTLVKEGMEIEWISPDLQRVLAQAMGESAAAPGTAELVTAGPAGPERRVDPVPDPGPERDER